MATAKVSVTLSEKVLREARRRVGKRGLSAYVDEAVRLKLQGDRIRNLVAELDKEYGPPPKRVVDQVAREWPVDPKPPRRRRRD